MRRLAAVFSSKRDKSDSHRQSDHSHPTSQPFKKHLKLPLTIGFTSPHQLRTPSSVTSTPQLSSVSDHAQSSGSSSGSASLSLPTPEEDSHPTSLARNSTRRSWKNWLSGKRSEPDPPSVPDLPKPPGRDRQVTAWDERPPTLQGPRTRHRVSKETDDTEDEPSEESDDEESISTSNHLRPSINRPTGFVASSEEARRNLEILINNGVNPPLPATPFVQYSADYLFPRSCNRPRPIPVYDMRRLMFKRRLLKRLEGLSSEDEKAILPFSMRNTPVSIPAPDLPSYETIRPPKSAQIFLASPGVRRWMSRPCFEDRFSVFLSSQDGVKQAPVTGTLAVTALEYSEFLDTMVDPDFDPSLSPSELQDAQWMPPLQDSIPNQSPSLELGSDLTFHPPSAHLRSSYLPSPSPLRNQHKSDVSLSDSTSQSTILAPVSTAILSMPLQNSDKKLPPSSLPTTPTPVVAPVKRVVRFVEDDTEDKVPLHLVRQKKKQEEKAKFLRAEQRKRLVEQEQERRRLEAEALAQEQKRLMKEKERKEIEQRQYTELVASTRLRRETQRAGIVPGLKLDSNGSLLAASPSTTSLRESERNRPREPRSSLMPHHTGSSTSIPRRDASDSALSLSHLHSLETSSYRSSGHSPGDSTSGHGHQSRPGSMYSSSSEDGWLNIKRHPNMPNSFTRPFPDRINSYPTWSGSNQSLHSISPALIPPPAPNFPFMPELTNDFVLLPPSAPFMMHHYGRHSRNPSPGRSTSSGSLRGASPNSSSERVNHSRQTSRRLKESAPPSPSTSLNFIDPRTTHMRPASPDTRRASMPVHGTNRGSTPRSQPSSLSRGRPLLPHSQAVQGIQHPQSQNPWTALPTQWGHLPTAMPMSPYTHSMSLNPSTKSPISKGPHRERLE